MNERCRAVVNIAGAHYQCDWEGPHDGWSHQNKQAQALWCSDAEARKFGNEPNTRSN